MAASDDGKTRSFKCRRNNNANGGFQYQQPITITIQYFLSQLISTAIRNRDCCKTRLQLEKRPLLSDANGQFDACFRYWSTSIDRYLLNSVNTGRKHGLWFSPTLSDKTPSDRDNNRPLKITSIVTGLVRRSE